MKKQFYRVKQLADQTFNKAEKSDLLNFEELQEADKNVEYLQEALTAFVKKVQPVPNMDVEKRMKKTLEFGLSSLYKNPKQHEDNRLFADIFRAFSDLQKQLAKEHAEHEDRVDQLVSGPMQKIVDQEFSNIAKQKKTLSKYILDKDSASNRYQVTKKDAIKEDMEEADNKVDHTRDNLALEMFNILARENEISTYILQYLKLQQAYYKSALDCLATNIPVLEQKIGSSKIKKIFGMPLEDHLQIYDTTIALPLEICVRALLNESSMEEEGLFRVAGSVLKVKRLKASLDSGCFKGLIPEYRDVHLLASIVKLYLRELPEPLLTFELYNDWMQVVKHPDHQRVAVMRKIIDRLPRGNRNNLAYFIQFLAKLVTYHKTNKMNTSNVATVVGPSLLWDRNQKDALNMSHCATINMIVETLIKEVHLFFPEDLTQFKSFSPLFVDEDRHNRNIHNDYSTSSESINNNIDTNSPKPASRGHKKRAPGPPSRTDQDLTTSEKSTMGACYPSGSSTLHRPPKVKSSVGVNTDDNSSFAKDAAVNFLNNETKPMPAVDLVKETHTNRKSEDFMSFDGADKGENGVIVTKAVYHVNHSKPVAAPRTHIPETKPETDGVVLRKPELPIKPEVPVRPASLSTAVKRSSDESTWKTHVQLSSVANKQQPALVNLHNSEHFQPGHDSHILRKEQFLHQHHHVVPAPRHSLGKPTNETSLPPPVPAPAPSPSPSPNANKNHQLSKSTEKLNDTSTSDTTNGNTKPSHIRTKSDGNIMDYGECTSPTSLAKTPPSPRNLNKPTQPPPPPPVVAKTRSSSDSTDL